MGYTNYWDRLQTIPEDTWDAIRRDFEKLILPLSDAGELPSKTALSRETISDRCWC
jgi:hypothetical protein